MDMETTLPVPRTSVLSRSWSNWKPLEDVCKLTIDQTSAVLQIT